MGFLVFFLPLTHPEVPETTAEAFPKVLGAVAEVFAERYGFPAEYRPRIETFALEEAAAAAGLDELGQCVKITGYDHYYRKRFGDYRVGFKVEGDVLTFYRVLHRREIYRYFP